ncbi:MAG: pirin family protein [Bacteroidota bacterium]
MKTILHRSETRGQANHGWLQSFHSFSFANYHNAERMHFGKLRVLNDDTVAPGGGFGTHPHENMEIISIPLAGDLEHKDSMGTKRTIREGDIQVMSAGTGVYHSEYNANADKEVKFLQIWIFPKARNVTPRYDQISINSLVKKNEISQILSPNSNDAGVWIHQDAWFSIGEFSESKTVDYKFHRPESGLYAFVLEGSAQISDHKLSSRDGLGIWDTENISITADANSRILLMEIPMN